MSEQRQAGSWASRPVELGDGVTDGRRLGRVVAIQPAGIHPAAEAAGTCVQVVWEHGRTSWVLLEEIWRVEAG